MQAHGWVDDQGRPIHPERFKTPQQGAATGLWALTSDRLVDFGGVYCEDCDVADVDDESADRGVRTYAIDPAQAERLCTLSAQRSGVDAFK